MDEPAAEPATERAVINAAAELHRLADELATRCLRFDPFRGTLLGLPEYDGLMPDASRAAEDSFGAELAEIRTAAAALQVSGPDRILAGALDTVILGELIDIENRAVEYTVTALPLSGPPAFMSVAARTVIPDETAAQNYLARLRAAPAWIDQIIERLRAGAAEGRTPVATLARTALAWVDSVLADEAPAALVRPSAPAEWAGAPEWAAEVARIARDEVRPAIERWRDVVRDELLPSARTDEHAGLAALPGGGPDYLRSIRRHTTLPLTADELHRTGLEQLEGLENRAAELGRSIGLADLDAVRAAVRAGTADDPLAALERAREAIRRAEARASEVVAPPLAPPCEIAAMPDTVASTGMAPHYTLPRADGSRPGTYWFNTLTPTVGTGWDLEAVAFHEAVPGHHLQLARDQAAADLPRLLTESLVTVHAEGWGLYAERLSGEMGLYSSVEQEIGAVFMEMHRACRLVVDTGLHAFGWSVGRAREFLVGHMPLSENFLHAEVDRYVAWPGQALAYLTGQREILRLRAVARAELGDAFDLAGFHGAVLDNGSLPMPVLELAVRDWISEQENDYTMFIASRTAPA